MFRTLACFRPSVLRISVFSPGTPGILAILERGSRLWFAPIVAFSQRFKLWVNEQSIESAEQRSQSQLVHSGGLDRRHLLDFTGWAQ